MKRVKIWVPDVNGNPVPSRMTLPEGWYALSVADIDKTPPANEKPAGAGDTGVPVTPEIPTVYASPAPMLRSFNP